MDPITIGLVCTAGYAVLSEIIGMNKKLKSNSVVQILLAVFKVGSGKRG